MQPDDLRPVVLVDRLPLRSHPRVHELADLEADLVDLGREREIDHAASAGRRPAASTRAAERRAEPSLTSCDRRPKPTSWDRDTLPQGDEKVQRGARDVRRDRAAVRPRQPDHDVPPRRAVAAAGRARARACRRRRVLDLASGHGRSVRRPRTAGHQPISVDLSFGMLAADRSGAPRVQADILRLPVPDRSVDGVTCGFALRNLVDLPAFFAELGTGRAAGRADRPARRRDPAQPDRPLGQRHLLRQGRAPDRRAPVGRRRVPVPPQERRLPAVAGDDGRDRFATPDSATPRTTSCPAASPSS